MAVFDDRELFETVDLYEGRNGKGYYDEKQAKKDRFKHAGIWIGLFIVFGGLLAFCLYRSIYEACLYQYGNKVTFTYEEYIESQPDINILRNDLDFSIYDKDTGTINLYYFGSDAAQAQALTVPVFWIGVDVVLILMDIFFIYMAYKNLKVTHYSEECKNKENE